MKKIKDKEIKLIFVAVILLFGGFLIFPVIQLLSKSVWENSGFTMTFYQEVFTSKGFGTALGNSFLVSSLAAVCTTGLAFLLAYTIHYTNVPKIIKTFLRTVALLPMLLPTITYGFAILYSFGKEGLLTKLFGKQFFQIYGIKGLLIGYIIYTLPISFMLLYNAMSYIDKKFVVVSRIMGDSPFTTFWITVIRPLLGTLAVSFVQSFFLSFTDFGIPAAVGGKFEVLSGVLYDRMLGSIPNFNNGAVVAMVMLVPSIVSIVLLHCLEKYNIRYTKISTIEIKKNRIRDVFCGALGSLFCWGILMIFLVIFVIPFVKQWPYELEFTFDNIKSVLTDTELSNVYLNSLYTAFFTAVFGTLIAYGSALITARSKVAKTLKNIIEGIALVTNTIPGMVLGLAFLFAFSGTRLQNTFAIIVMCNAIHFFSTPYLMMKESLTKMNASWETTAMLMGDSWLQTIVRIVTPNALSTIIEVFSYYFINAMVTISAVIFLAGARTMVITTKIKQLQYYNQYNEIFVLSIFLLLTNLACKLLFQYLAKREKRAGKTSKRKEVLTKNKSLRTVRRVVSMALTMILMFSSISLISGGRNSHLVVIYSNADDEAITAMKKTLNENGYRGKYILQSFGTSELGGKLLAEGNHLEADMITMSTFYVDSAQKVNNMFTTLNFGKQTLLASSPWCQPITAQEGAILVNTTVLKEEGLPTPKSLKDLADPIYKNMVSVTDLSSSSTGWLLVQALVDAYGEAGAENILTKIYENAGPHIEDSGSGPLKKVRAGEVAVGFGLRHQAVADKKAGLPVDYVDPLEGNFSLTESVAVLNKNTARVKLATEMAQCIVERGRKELQKTYPLPVYEGETQELKSKSLYPKVFSKPLTVELLKEHQQLSERCK